MLPTRPPKIKPRGRQPEHALTNAFVRNVGRAGRYCDGHGLYLDVRPTGSRSWVQRLAIRGRRRELGLGGFPLVSLKEAREIAFANRKLARSGGDPLAEKRRASGMPTFAEAAERVWNDLRPGWSNPRHAHNWKSSLTRFAFPHIGRMPVCDVTSADVIDTLRRIWHEHPTTARRVRHRIRAVLEWAVAMELRNDNPCDRIGPALGPQNDIVTHRQALPHRDVAAALAAVRASDAAPLVKLALEFLVLTAVRSGDVRGALWAEIDIADRVWTIPATRIKMKREHRVPLCDRAIEILDAARRLGAGRPLVFPTPRGKQFTGMALSGLLKRLEIAAVPHGFRSSFRDWVAEETDHPREVAEAALAHLVRNPVEAAYARSDLFERRRRLMNDWAAYIANTTSEQSTDAEPEPAQQGVGPRHPDPR